MSGMNNLNRKRPIRFAKEKMNKHAMNHDEKKKVKIADLGPAQMRLIVIHA